MADAKENRKPPRKVLKSAKKDEFVSQQDAKTQKKKYTPSRKIGFKVMLEMAQRDLATSS
ncbi:hypothetical protein OUZ56_005311 [Daphnia magna]|uniref:Uncharacterized protein n=1 Tax=Daphnia magna TaxID=35525 RepID=A0ABQ9YSF8_9CRUS|nr:hypothetical protein OUZ56_005311 [Daphnia magna]